MKIWDSNIRIVRNTTQELICCIVYTLRQLRYNLFYFIFLDFFFIFSKLFVILLYFLCTNNCFFTLRRHNCIWMLHLSMQLIIYYHMRAEILVLNLFIRLRLNFLTFIYVDGIQIFNLVLIREYVWKIMLIALSATFIINLVTNLNIIHILDFVLLICVLPLPLIFFIVTSICCLHFNLWIVLFFYILF